ncbi:MAG: hypothetical protein ACWGSQ_07980 [Longimicrobiales bacterium]
MARPRIRPTFTISLTSDADTAMSTLRQRLKGTEYEECSRSKGRCADFFVKDSERRVWSPCLSVQVEPAPAGSLLRGRFGPHPELWTLFMFLYAAVGFLAVMGLMLGFVQWQSGLEAWGFWGAYLGFPGLGALYAVSATGQHLSAHQMEELRERLDALLEGLRSPAREIPASEGDPEA